MATIHTNNLTGSDTTGDGTSALPYKTVNKALSVAVDNDLIKVAGGQWVQVTGTVTTTNRGSSITTSVDMTGSFTAGDIIAIDTFSADGWEKDKTILVINTINATTITLASVTTQFKAGTYNIYKLDNYHYNTTATSGVQETISAFTATSLTVSGGWDPTYTTQLGWTASRFGGANGNATAGTFMSWAFIKPNIIFDRFMPIKSGFWANATTSVGINTINLVRSTNPFASSNAGVYAPSSVGFTTIISNGGTDLTTSWNGSANRPTTLNLKQWHTTFDSSYTRIKTGYQLGQGATAGPTIRCTEVYWRSLGQFGGSQPGYDIVQNVGGDIFIDQLNLFIGGNLIQPLFPANDLPQNESWRFIGDLNVTRFDTSISGITPIKGTYNTNMPTFGYPFNVNRISGTLESLPWLGYGSTDTIQNWYTLGSGSIYGKDTEGYKVINCDQIPKYADPTQYVTGSNSFRMKLLTTVAGGDNFVYCAATMAKPTSSFTLTIKAKASKSVTVSDVRLQYGQSINQYASLGGITLTTSWQDFTFTITPSSYTNWSFGDDGLMVIALRISSGQTTINDNDFIYIDSVTTS